MVLNAAMQQGRAGEGAGACLDLYHAIFLSRLLCSLCTVLLQLRQLLQKGSTQNVFLEGSLSCGVAIKPAYMIIRVFVCYKGILRCPSTTCSSQYLPVLVRSSTWIP